MTFTFNTLLFIQRGCRYAMAPCYFCGGTLDGYVRRVPFTKEKAIAKRQPWIRINKKVVQPPHLSTAGLHLVLLYYTCYFLKSSNSSSFVMINTLRIRFER